MARDTHRIAAHGEADVAEITLTVKAVGPSEDWPDGGYIANLATTAEDGSHWACASDPRPTRDAALFQCLAIAIANTKI